MLSLIIWNLAPQIPVIRSFNTYFSNVVTKQFVFQWLKFHRQNVRENISIEFMKWIIRVVENLKTMKNYTRSRILQVYRTRILTDQRVDVGQHSRTAADGPVVNKYSYSSGEEEHFYRTKKFSVLWILFSGSSNRVHGRTDLFRPGHDAWRRLGLLYWLIVYTLYDGRFVNVYEPRNF